MDNKFYASIFPQNILVHFIRTEIIFLKDITIGICNGDKMCFFFCAVVLGVIKLYFHKFISSKTKADFLFVS